MAEKLLSIVIPTKDREYYCQRVLDYMLTFDDDRIEFVIQNNGSSNELDEYIKKKNDSRIIYKHVYKPLCQVDNSDQSIALSSGRYICFIGDDDIVLPNIMQYVEYAIDNNIDNIAQNNLIGYIWPTDKFPTGRLNFILPGEKEVVVTNQEECVNNYIRNGCCKNPKIFNLPVLYHGITRRQCIEDVKNETGHYVGGTSPDSYTSVTLAKYVKKMVIINRSFSIAGACPQSATAISNAGKHCGTLDDAPHLKNREAYVWDTLIPRYYSVQTIWAESAVTALRETNHPCLGKFNLRELFCMSYVNNKSIRNLVIRQTNICLSENEIKKMPFWTICIFKVIYRKSQMFINELLGYASHFLKLTDFRSKTDVLDISDCVKYIC